MALLLFCTCNCVKLRRNERVRPCVSLFVSFRYVLVGVGERQSVSPVLRGVACWDTLIVRAARSSRSAVLYTDTSEHI